MPSTFKFLISLLLQLPEILSKSNVYDFATKISDLLIASLSWSSAKQYRLPCPYYDSEVLYNYKLLCKHQNLFGKPKGFLLVLIFSLNSQLSDSYYFWREFCQNVCGKA